MQITLSQFVVFCCSLVFGFGFGLFVFIIYYMHFSKEKCRRGIPESSDENTKKYKALWRKLLIYVCFCFFILCSMLLFICAYFRFFIVNINILPPGNLT